MIDARKPGLLLFAPQQHLSRAVGRAAERGGPAPGQSWWQATGRPRRAPPGARTVGLPATVRIGQIRSHEEYRRRRPGEEADRRRYAPARRTDFVPSGWSVPEGFGRSASGRTVKERVDERSSSCGLGCDGSCCVYLAAARGGFRAVHVGSETVPTDASFGLDQEDSFRPKRAVIAQCFVHRCLAFTDETTERRL